MLTSHFTISGISDTPACWHDPRKFKNNQKVCTGECQDSSSMYVTTDKIWIDYFDLIIIHREKLEA